MSATVSTENSTSSIPDHFICPISLEIMEDPVICSDGNTYERREIMRWLISHDTSPKTNMILANKNLIANYAIKSGISKFLAGRPETTARIRAMRVSQRTFVHGFFFVTVILFFSFLSFPFQTRSTLDSPVELTPEKKMQVFVRLVTNMSISTFIDKHATVQDLMNEVERVDGITASQQRLIYAGKQMEPHKALIRYGVKTGAVVHLVLRLVGGKK
jgi:hypothetical protein